MNRNLMTDLVFGTLFMSMALISVVGFVYDISPLIWFGCGQLFLLGVYVKGMGHD